MNEKKNVKKKILSKGKTKNKKMIKNKLNIRKMLAYTAFWAICILAVIGIVMLARHLIIKWKYSYYTEKMEWYGYNKLYDNEKATSTEEVLSDEIAKMVVGILYNETSKDFAENKLYRIDDTELSTNETWLEFAKSIPILSANHVTFGEKTSKLQVAKLIVEGIEVLYEDIEITEGLKEKYRKDYDEEELELIDKSISIGILKNSKYDINKVGMLKGELNKMLITIVEKYSTVYYNNIYSIDQKATVIKDKKELPSNAEKYPYVIDTISKEIYEIEMPEMLGEISETPKEVYDIYHDVYYDSEANMEKYFDIILNIDYRTIDAEDMIDILNQYVVYDINYKIGDSQLYREKIEKYVQYVKENEIVLTGKVIPQLPIIYSNGMLHFLRCKIEFEVVNSKTNKNLLLWDSNVTYNSNSIDVYTDVAVSPNLNSKAFRIFNGISTMRYLVKDLNNSVIVEQ